jgi:heme-degrading monooxygenase HmoA
MYLRFVQLKIEPDRIDDFERLYEHRISRALQDTEGCLFAGLLHRRGPTEECISMTLWETPGDAKRYEDSGLYETLLREADPMIADSAEWRIRLSSDLRLEYGPVKEAPVVTASSVESERTSEVPSEVADDDTYLRIVSARVKSGAFDELARVYEEQIVPALKKVDGCRYAYLVRGMQEEDMALSITLWDSQSQAEAYEQGGRFGDMMRLIRPMLSELLQWKMALSPQKQDEIATSDDVTIEGYHVVTSDTFSHIGTH